MIPVWAAVAVAVLGTWDAVLTELRQRRPEPVARRTRAEAAALGWQTRRAHQTPEEISALAAKAGGQSWRHVRAFSRRRRDRATLN